MRREVDFIPSWVPQPALRYLVHTENGVPIRALARAAGCHASTVLRQIRMVETRREDPLVDDALKRLGKQVYDRTRSGSPKMEAKMTALPIHLTAAESTLSEDRLKQEGRRALRRLCEKGAILAVAPEMDRAVIVRETDDREPTRIGIVDKPVAEAMALKGWIQCDTPGRIMRYAITRAGREALDHLLAVPGQGGPLADPAEADEDAVQAIKRRRYGVSDTPLGSLARRKNTDGTPFLADDLVRAGERLREDYELTLMSPELAAGLAQAWDKIMWGAATPDLTLSDAPHPASQRMISALRDLGPGLGDVVLRCCCYLEGLERIEKAMGWSARSGKIVLRIALQRLKRHYDTLGAAGEMIG